MSDSGVDSFPLWSVEAAHVLEAAASQAALDRNSARALSAMWSADLHRIQGALWAELVTKQRWSRRDYFNVLQDLVVTDIASVDARTAQDYLDAARSTILAGLGELLPEGIALTTITDLASLPAPVEADWGRQRDGLLDGLRASDIVHARRRQSADLMLRALRAQQSGDDAQGIAWAYESDMAALDAYLVESAIAAGDGDLITVVARWILVSDRMSGVSALPSDFARAVRTVRTVLAEALGDADGPRMLAGLQPFSA